MNNKKVRALRKLAEKKRYRLDDKKVITEINETHFKELKRNYKYLDEKQRSKIK